MVELRKTLFLPLDDLLAVTREFLCTDVSRSGLDRCLRRHGVGNLHALKPATPKEPHKAFKVYEPGYLRTDKILVVGTNVYALDGEKLVWASRSETFNPGDLPKVVKDVVAANAKAVRAEIGR